MPPPGSEDLSSEGRISPLDPRKINFMERFTKQTGVAAANYRQEKWLHLPKAFRQLRRKRSIIVKEPLIAFLPSLGSLTPELFPKVFTNQRMGVEMSRIVRIFTSEESCSS
jgi:hypothetical protein